MLKKIAMLSGDGIGPEIMAEAEKVLGKISSIYNMEFEFTHADVGGIAIDNQGEALPGSTVDICKNSEAILFGAVGGPKWESLPPEKQPERGALLPLRKLFGLYANLRPAIIFNDLKSASPLKPEIIKDGFDIMIIRELTGGIYFGSPKGREGDRAYDTLIYTESEIKRIARVAFETAMKRSKRLTSIDKANVLISMVMWREIVNEVSKDYPKVELNHMYVDNAAMQLVRNPGQFDVLLCGNMFGDILSDEASMITGSMGMLPSASLSDGTVGLYEPAGGSAPDIAGEGIANPIAQVLSAAMMLKYSFNLDDAYDRIFKAVENVLSEGYRTIDIMSEGKNEVGTAKMGDLIVSKL